MQEFNFEKITAEIKIEGKVYTFDPADSEMMDKLLGVSNKLSSVKFDKANDAIMMTLSRELRNVVGAVLGKEAQEEIFANKDHNVMQEILLISKLLDAREEAGVDSQVEKLLKSFGPPTVDE